MATSEIHVSFLDGSVQRLAVRPDTTAGELREQLEDARTFPTQWHGLRLFRGTEELRGADSIWPRITVEATSHMTLTMQPGCSFAQLGSQLEQERKRRVKLSRPKFFYNGKEVSDEDPLDMTFQAVAEASIDRLLEFFERLCDSDTWRNTLSKPNFKEQFDSAVSLLKQTSLHREAAERLFQVLIGLDALHGLSADLQAMVQTALGEALGLACEEPLAVMQGLCALLQQRRSGFGMVRTHVTLLDARTSLAAVSALKELAVRCPDALTGHAHELLKFSEDMLLRGDDSNAILAAARLLGALGDAKHKKMLRAAALAIDGDDFDNASGTTKHELCQALRLISYRERGARHADASAASSDSRQSWPNTLDRRIGLNADEPTRELRQRDAHRGRELEEQMAREQEEQHTKMRLALHMDEQRLLEAEAADLAEAIFRSKSETSAD